MNSQFQPRLERAGYPIQIAQIETRPSQTTSNGNALTGLVNAAPIAAFSLLGLLLFIWFLKSCLQICNPNEILVLSGRKHRNEKGESVGYRVLFGGRTVVIPILESVERINITTMPVPVEVRNAYSKGGTPLHIQAIANVKISSDPQIVGNAIERFLGRDRNEIIRVARETLEGNLRGVVAMLTPEQVNEDRLKFAERIAQDVSRDLAKLGIQLDTLKIQSVADDLDYLRSIGRQRIAQVIRDAEIAEAEAVGQADRIEAECDQQAKVAQTQALAIIQEKRNELRTIRAELERQAKSEEERTTAAGEEARARAEQQLQTVRAELERLRLEAEEVLPAEAERQAKVFQARGNAAQLAENAKATAQVNDLLSQVWRESGNVKEMLLIQQIETVLKEAAKMPSRIKLQHINVIDSGNGESLSNLAGIYYPMVRQFLDQVDQNLGIDVVETLNRQQEALPIQPIATATPQQSQGGQ